jgi:hypothetical protein
MESLSNPPYMTINNMKYSTFLCNNNYTNNRVILDEKEPNKCITQSDMCPFNNGCKDTVNYSYLNQRGVKPSPFFVEKEGDFLKKTFASTVPDGRLADIGRGFFTQTLDSKPVQVYYNLINDNISQSQELNTYGLGYKSYETVSGGQVQYYIDKEISDPFIRPVYGMQSKAEGVTWTDPMSARKVQFNKKYPEKNTACLSWIQDSSSQRDDITALQQRKFNEQRYDLLYNRI